MGDREKEREVSPGFERDEREKERKREREKKRERERYKRINISLLGDERKKFSSVR